MSEKAKLKSFSVSSGHSDELDDEKVMIGDSAVESVDESGDEILVEGDEVLVEVSVEEGDVEVDVGDVEEVGGVEDETGVLDEDVTVVVETADDEIEDENVVDFVENVVDFVENEDDNVVDFVEKEDVNDVVLSEENNDDVEVVDPEDDIVEPEDMENNSDGDELVDGNVTDPVEGKRRRRKKRSEGSKNPNPEDRDSKQKRRIRDKDSKKRKEVSPDAVTEETPTKRSSASKQDTLLPEPEANPDVEPKKSRKKDDRKSVPETVETPETVPEQDPKKSKKDPKKPSTEVIAPEQDQKKNKKNKETKKSTEINIVATETTPKKSKPKKTDEINVPEESLQKKYSKRNREAITENTDLGDAISPINKKSSKHQRITDDPPDSKHSPRSVKGMSKETDVSNDKEPQVIVKKNSKRSITDEAIDIVEETKQKRHSKKRDDTEPLVSTNEPAQDEPKNTTLKRAKENSKNLKTTLEDEKKELKQSKENQEPEPKNEATDDKSEKSSKRTKKIREESPDVDVQISEEILGRKMKIETERKVKKDKDPNKKSKKLQRKEIKKMKKQIKKRKASGNLSIGDNDELAVEDVSSESDNGDDDDSDTLSDSGSYSSESSNNVNVIEIDVELQEIFDGFLLEELVYIKSKSQKKRWNLRSLFLKDGILLIKGTSFLSKVRADIPLANCDVNLGDPIRKRENILLIRQDETTLVISFNTADTREEWFNMILSVKDKRVANDNKKSSLERYGNKVVSTKAGRKLITEILGKDATKSMKIVKEAIALKKDKFEASLFEKNVYKLSFKLISDIRKGDYDKEALKKSKRTFLVLWNKVQDYIGLINFAYDGSEIQSLTLLYLHEVTQIFTPNFSPKQMENWNWVVDKITSLLFLDTIFTRPEFAEGRVKLEKILAKYNLSVQ